MLLPIEERKRLLKEYPIMFSRLIVMGFPVNKMLEKSALIVGAGGLGTIIAESLARMGIGELIIVDRDVVLPENFNRLGYYWDDVGKPKAKALAEKLDRLRNVRGIPEKFRLKLEAYKADIVGWDLLDNLVKKVDIVFSALDNDIARRELNYTIVLYRKPMINGATSIDGFSGTILTVIPGVTPCYECYYHRTTVRVRNVERVGGCDASIATTMNIIATLMVDQGVKVLLNYGEIYPLIKVYLKEGIEVKKVKGLKPNPNCPVCGRLRNDSRYG